LVSQFKEETLLHLELLHRVVELEDLEQVVQVVEQTLVHQLVWVLLAKEIMEDKETLVLLLHKVPILAVAVEEQELQDLTLP
jgi:hypothetical protein